MYHYYYFQKNHNSSAGLCYYTVEQLELFSRRVHAVQPSSGPHGRASSHHIDHLLLHVAGATSTAIHCASNWLLRLSGKQTQNENPTRKNKRQSSNDNTSTASSTITCSGR